ncbi:MAG: NAD(P)/FAD-dependent oxidoreductase [Pedobacter sp.]|nr:NAD(P)/FAD-dependent oxidoreductase [Pedobacter sp.]
MKVPEEEIVIIGGGLAGLVCAIDLLKRGKPVTLIEKHAYPHHKVCGEFISNEVRSYLHSLALDVKSLKPAEISQFSLSTPTGTMITCQLPLGGFGISRFTIDHFLFQKALLAGCKIITDTVENILFSDNLFAIHTQGNGVIKARIAIGAFGKRATIDQRLKRKFITKKSPWLAVKGHYQGNIKDDMVSLHLFKGGYCGVSRVENDIVNICYLAEYKHFKPYKTIKDFQQKVLYKNPQLKNIFENFIPLFSEPLSISQISFAKKEQVNEHILMIGDTAGLIHPLCGNGMAMAIHSAKICAKLCAQFLDGQIKTRDLLEQNYIATWNSNFQYRLRMGRILSTIIKKEKLFNILLRLMATFPALLRMIIRNTHGKPNI